MIGWWLVASAQAGELGLGVGAALDLPDPDQGEAATRFGPAVDLVVPYRFTLAPSAALRVQLHAAFTKGRDVLAFTMPGTGPQTLPQTSTYVGQLGLGIGPEIRFADPDGDAPVAPYLAGDVGMALVNHWHTDLRQPELFDPAYYAPEDLTNPRTISPSTHQLVPATSVALGVRFGRAWTELGYELMYLEAGDLRHGTPAIVPEREAYFWNAVHLRLGFDLSSSRPTAAPTKG